MLRISQDTVSLLICPHCQHGLSISTVSLTCSSNTCSRTFPILNDVPILIDDDTSIFSIQDFLLDKETTFKKSYFSKLRDFEKYFPSLVENINAKENYKYLTTLLYKPETKSKVLIIGGGIIGKGMEGFLNNSNIEFVETDVALAPRAAIICDGLSLPFKDHSFDGVIVQAVLEHVLDPYKCVAEIFRVLKTDGIVYAETPFMQQVHMRQFDFTRFTRLGHRRLFRNFVEIKSGISSGPGMALAWTYQYFLLSFTTSKLIRNLIKVFSRITAFHLKYFDYYLYKKDGALDAASGFYFIGKKSNKILSDKELINSYKGGF